MKGLPTALGLMVLAAVGFGANALLAARTTGDDEATSAGPAARALPVETTRLVPVDSIEVTRTFTGQVAARQVAALAFEGSGRIVSMLVDEGDSVAAGQTVGTLDRAELEARRAEIEARRTRLQATLDELIEGPRKETIEAARSNVEAVQEELDLAILQSDRREELAEKGTISAEQLDSTRALVKQLKARLAAARAQLAELENGTREETLTAQRGALLELDASLNTLDVALEKTILKAPFAGTVTARYLDEGAVVSQQMPSAAIELVETSVLEAHVGVPVELARGIVSGEAQSTLDLRGQTIESTQAVALGTVAPGTRTVTVIFDLDAASSGEAGARPGDVITLHTVVSREERGAWVPLGALSESSRGLWSAFAVREPKDGSGPATAERIELEVLSAGESRAFVRGTFDEETTIVASGAGRIVAGQAIRASQNAEQ